MSFFKKAFSKIFYQSLFFWLLFFITLYTFVGFIVLPQLIKNTLIEQVKLNFNYQTNIEKVALNPYTLTLDIEQLSIDDVQNNRIFSFEQYHINLELSSVIKGALTFASVSLLKPNLNLTLDKSGISNIQQAFTAQQLLIKKTSESDDIITPENKNKSALVKLFIQQISVRNGSISLLDKRPQTAISHQLNPINFTVSNFSTYVKDNGQYSLDISLGEQQKLSWQGSIALFPFRSQGKLKVSNINLAKLQGYFAKQNPYVIQSALASINSEYKFTTAKKHTDFSVSNTTLTLDNVNTLLKDSSARFFDFNQIQVGPLNFDITKNALHIDAVKINDINVVIERNKQGEVSFLTPIHALISAQVELETNNADKNNVIVAKKKDHQNSPPFTWAIKQFSLNNGQVSFHDQQPETPANINIKTINVSLNHLSQNLSLPVDFNLEYLLNQSGTSHFTGKITPQPFQLSSDVNLTNIDLTMLQPYVNEQAKVEITQGALSLQGNVELQSDKQNALSGGFTGNLAVEQFNTNDQQLQQKIIGWQHLSIKPFTINFQPLSIDISNITFVKPYARLVVTEDRTINLTNLVKSKSSEKNISSNTQQTASTTPTMVNINNLSFTNGSAFFADLSLEPQFGTSIQNINGTISGLSSDNLEQATVDVQGTIDQYGKMSVQGKINPLSGDLYTDINARFDKIELTTLTPYSGRYAGFVIDKGRMSLDLNYQIANSQMTGNNRLILDHLEFGSPVNSDEILSLPLKLALALFKDRNGVIDISLPTSGDIDDPDFAFGGLITKAFMNMISKAVLSPFSMIANLAGGNAEQLSSVSFDLGSSLLSSKEFLSLDKLANILKTRPLLILEIRSNVDPINDVNMLKKIKLIEQLGKLTPENANQQQQIVVMETLLSSRVSKEKTKQLQTTYKAELSSIVDEKGQTISLINKEVVLTSYQQNLQQALLVSEQVSSLELTTLAKERIASIKSYLVEQRQVSHEQVFALQPSMTGKTKDSKIVTTFTLSSH